MKKNILIVDDDVAILNVLVRILEVEDYRLDTSFTGKVLLKKMFYSPDLIILDKQLSDMDGAEICKQLKKQKATRKIPIILISAVSDLRDVAKKAGADDYIEKPFNICELLGKVKRLI